MFLIWVGNEFQNLPSADAFPHNYSFYSFLAGTCAILNVIYTDNNIIITLFIINIAFLSYSFGNLSSSDPQLMHARLPA